MNFNDILDACRKENSSCSTVSLGKETNLSSPHCECIPTVEIKTIAEISGCQKMPGKVSRTKLNNYTAF